MFHYKGVLVYTYPKNVTVRCLQTGTENRGCTINYCTELVEYDKGKKNKLGAPWLFLLMTGEI
ncbi:hypothetical protein [Gracilibacillus alcaliphilus]|uniref:hypothetical protein n=1 Tax=Gracilibacillus alcaliphilus TaxID=1401441 RepID=UPI00195AE87F|nr:hypothetical protein [Gracilibacillus alcaliphilus]MBM7679255.1 hypothetical protein [Gracilibacillus alcaliphilus]